MMLVVLMVSTSLALAITVSVWLVPPYLVLMVWILAPVRGLRDPVPVSDEPGSEPVSGGDRLREPAEPGVELRSQAEPDAAAFSLTEAEADQDGVNNDPESVAVKTTRRGKGRGRKAKGGAVTEPAAATASWIQVGPGKFVRVEGPNENAPAEPPVALSESETADPLAPASPVAEAAAEPVSRELATEVGPEPEGRSATLDAPAPAARGEFPQEEPPFADNALASPDAEAWLRPSPEEVALPEEEPVSRELATEAGPEPEGRSATLDAPAPAVCDELLQGEPIPDSVLPPTDAEVFLPSGPEEVDLPALERSLDADLHHDAESRVDDVACEEAPAFNEVAAEIEEASDGLAIATAASVSAALGWEDSEIGPVEPSGDQSIALDAPDVGRTTETEDLLLLEAARAARSPSLRTISSPSRSTDKAPFVSWRGVWPRAGLAVDRIAGTRPSGRVARSGPKARVASGPRRRSRRGVGQYRLACRTFPPRSPPVVGLIRRFEAGRGVRRCD